MTLIYMSLTPNFWSGCGKADDCWGEGNRDSRGNLVARSSTFPSGIKALADYVHARGLKLGIYSDAG